MRFYIGFCFIFICLWGCAQQPKPATVATVPTLPAVDPAFKQPADLPDTADFYRLTAQQQQQFLTFFQHPDRSDMPANQRVFAYLEQHLQNFNYQGANTLAQQSLENLSGNCMSLALLVTALAKLVETEVDIGFRATYREPVLNISAQTLLTSNHVRSYLYEKPTEQQKKKLLGRKAISIDYFRASLDRLGPRLSTATFEAMMYNNLAVDALLAGDMDRSYWLSRQALELDPTFQDSINLIAVIYRRKGELMTASQWYDIGLQKEQAGATLLSNYLALAEQLEDKRLVRKLQQKLRLSEDDNPYVWFDFAYKAEQANNYDDAVHYYRKLIFSAPYLHQANLALAKLYLQKNDLASARAALTQALQYSYEPDYKIRYQAKLKMLEQLAAK